MPNNKLIEEISQMDKMMLKWVKRKLFLLALFGFSSLSLREKKYDLKKISLGEVLLIFHKEKITNAQLCKYTV